MHQPHNATNIFTERTKCPICSSYKMETLLQNNYESEELRKFISLEQTFKHDFWHDFNQGYFNGQFFKVVKCINCDFIFQANIFNEIGMKLLYDKWIDPQATLERHKKLNLPTKQSLEHTQRLNLILRCFSDTPNIEVLDWGGGFGDFSAMAKICGVNITALEFSDERAAHLESREIPALRIDELQQKHYHFINLNQVLEHVTEPVGLLREIRKFMRDDGILYVSVPKCDQAERLLRSGILSQKTFDCLSPQHINAFTNKTLKMACNNAGFKVLFAVNPRPVLFSNRQNWRYSIKEILKNIVRPLSYFFLGTGFFLGKSTKLKKPEVT